ncbi:MAG: hypothetical protein RLZZ164_97 [Actinomycetota bacterium]|jgi:uncharacterized membrane protein YczE
MFKELTWTNSFRLMTGLMFYGLGLSLIVQAHIGVPPWDVLALGISNTLSVSYGMASILVSFMALLAWIPLKVKPGIGSIANAILIGLWADFFMQFIKPFDGFWVSLLMFCAGMVIVAVATGLYISAKLGKGPRDGLMLGTAAALKTKLWIVRTGYEIAVLTIGWLLGGQVGLGTVLFAVCIGYLMQTSIRLFKADN